MPQPRAGGARRANRRPPLHGPKKQAPTPPRRLSRRPHAPQAPRLHRCRHDRPTIDAADADPGSAVRDRLARVGTGGAMKSSRIALTVLGRLGRAQPTPWEGEAAVRRVGQGLSCRRSSTSRQPTAGSHRRACSDQAARLNRVSWGLWPPASTRQLEGFAQFIQRADGYGFAVLASPVPAFGRTDFHPRLAATLASGDFLCARSGQF